MIKLQTADFRCTHQGPRCTHRSPRCRLRNPWCILGSFSPNNYDSKMKAALFKLRTGSLAPLLVCWLKNGSLKSKAQGSKHFGAASFVFERPGLSQRTEMWAVLLVTNKWQVTGPVECDGSSTHSEKVRLPPAGAGLHGAGLHGKRPLTGCTFILCRAGFLGLPVRRLGSQRCTMKERNLEC